MKTGNYAVLVEDEKGGAELQCGGGHAGMLIVSGGGGGNAKVLANAAVAKKRREGENTHQTESALIEKT